MKNLAIVLVAVVVMVAPSHAVLLFEETFEGAGFGDSVVDTGNWSYMDGETMTITDVVVDSGNSAHGEPGGAWTNELRSNLINHTLSASELGFRYSWTMADHDGDGS